MPNIHVPLPETQQNVFRPIVLDIVKQVQEITLMKDTQIYWPEEEGKNQTASGTIDSKADRYVVTSSKRMNAIEVEEEIDPEEISPTFFNSKEYPAILEDRKLGLNMSPIYAKHNVRVTFNYNCASKTEAERWLQDMRMKIGKLRDINTHTVTYHYNLHKKLYEIVHLVHTLRESQAGYGDTFDEYLKSHATGRLTVVGDIVGKDKIFAVAETQTEIYGIYDFSGLPAHPEKNTESGMWVISFVYKFNYDKPIGCDLRYPVIVHNKEMPYELVSFYQQEVRAIAQEPTSGSRTQNALRMFRSDCVMDNVKSEDGVIVIPRFDDFIPENYFTATAGVVQALAQITPEDRKSLINLQELGDVVLDRDVIEFLKSEYQYLTRPCMSIFHVSFYQNTTLQHYDRIEIDSNLNITSVLDLNVRNQYRIRLSVVTDIDILTNDAITRLRHYPKVLCKIVSAINRAFRENPEANKLGREKFITKCEFSALYRVLMGKESATEFAGYNQIGFTTDGLLQQKCISKSFLNQVRMEYRKPMNTMIAGTLVYRAGDKNFEQAPLGSLNIPVPAPTPV